MIFLLQSRSEMDLSPTNVRLRQLLRTIYEHFFCRYSGAVADSFSHALERLLQKERDAFLNDLETSQWLYDLGRKALDQVKEWPTNDKAVPQKYTKKSTQKRHSRSRLSKRSSRIAMTTL